MTDAPSPFIEGTNIQFALDSVSLNAAKKCLKYYKYTLIDGYRKKDESVHLKFGAELARWLEFYHKCRAYGMEYEDSLEETVAWLLAGTFGWNSDHPTKNRATLIRSVIWYLESYKDDQVETVILANGKPAVELSFKIELPWEAAPGQPYLLCGHGDRIIKYGDEIFWQDQKTTAGGIGSYYFKQFNPNGQMSAYTIAGKVIFDLPIAGVMIDAIKVLVGSTDFARSFTNRTQGQLDEWMDDLKKWTELLKFAAENNYWPGNDTACHMYDGCTFRDCCSQDPAVQQSYLDTYFEKQHWNPLVPR